MVRKSKEATKEYNRQYYLKNNVKLKKASKTYRDEHKDYYKEYNDNYQKEHKVDISLQKKQHRLDNIEFFKQKDKNYRLNNIEKCKARDKEYQEKNKIQIKERRKQYYHNRGGKEKTIVWRKNNVVRTRQSRNRWQKNELENNINYKLRCRITVRHDMALRKNCKTKHTVDYLGCSYQEYKIYLENKFIDGMTWENWGNDEGKWNIDHIIPLASFDLSKEEERIKAFHYTNTQPLWWRENLSKGDRIEVCCEY